MFTLFKCCAFHDHPVEGRSSKKIVLYTKTTKNSLFLFPTHFNRREVVPEKPYSPGDLLWVFSHSCSRGVLWNWHTTMCNSNYNIRSDWIEKWYMLFKDDLQWEILLSCSEPILATQAVELMLICHLINTFMRRICLSRQNQHMTSFSESYSCLSPLSGTQKSWVKRAVERLGLPLQLF